MSFDPDHRLFLARDACRALDFFDASPRADGGFHTLDGAGRPLPDTLQELHATTRLVHSYALAALAGRPDSAGIVDQGMDLLWNGHRDHAHGGYLWSVGGADPDGTKLAYGHVFVLLAASSALMLGHPDANRLLADSLDIIETHFWDERAGLLRDEFTQGWQPFSTYRGMNANMHGIEAFLTAYETTGEAVHLDRAGRILGFFIAGQAMRNDWRIPEHYTADWQPDPDHAGNPMFRPKGTTPGHSLEMARLLLQHWDLTGRRDPEAPAMARNLMHRALTDAWDPDRGGLAYTLDRDGRVADPARYWWPVTEGLAALAMLLKLDPHADDRKWYDRLWHFADDSLIDHQAGGWHPEPHDQSPTGQFAGKPDLYHALQADLFTLSPGLSRHAEGLAQTTPLAGDHDGTSRMTPLT